MEIAFLSCGKDIERYRGLSSEKVRRGSPPPRRGSSIQTKVSGMGRDSRASHSGVPERSRRVIRLVPRSSLTRRTLSLRRQPALSNWLHPVPHPSLVHYNVLWASKLPSSTGRIYRDPNVFRSLAGGEQFISTRSPKPVVQWPPDVLTSTHLWTTSSMYRCVASVSLSLSLSLSLLRCMVYRDIPQNLLWNEPVNAWKMVWVKMSVLKFILVGSTQPVVSWPRNVLTIVISHDII